MASYSGSMDYFFAVTYDDQPVTIAIDDEIDRALVIIGAEPDSPSVAMDIRHAFTFKNNVELFDAAEVWALIIAIREEVSDTIAYASNLLEANS